MRTRSLTLFLCAAYAPWVYASASHDAGINWWHLGSAYKDAPALGWLTITFIIFVYLLARFAKKPLSAHLEARSHEIKQQIEEGRLAKIESEKKLRLYEEKLRSLHEEIEKMKQVFLEQGRAQREERERQAQEMALRIARDIDDVIRANYERAKKRLAEIVMNEAMLIAKRRLIEHQSDAHKLLSQHFVADLKVQAGEMHP